MDWQRLIEERNTWIKHNFPDTPYYHTVLGVIEEVGELTHHFLKKEQQIRGTDEEHDDEMQDAVGDCTVYLLGCMNDTGKDEAYDGYGLVVSDSAATTLFSLSASVGDIAFDQVTNRKSDVVGIGEVVSLLREFCRHMSWDYEAIVIKTWEKVSKRDWIADPTAGGET